MFNFTKRDEPVKIRFYFGSQAENRKRLTWDDLEVIEAIQNGDASLRGMKGLAARFMADERNQYLPTEKALKVLGALSADDIQDVLRQFTEGLTASAVNPQRGSDSNSRSEAGQVETLPDGQRP